MALLKFHLKVRSVYQDVSSLAGPDFGLCGAGDALLGFAASLQRLLSGLPCVSVRGPQDSALPGRSASSGTSRSFFEVPFHPGASTPGCLGSPELQFLSSLLAPTACAGHRQAPQRGAGTFPARPSSPRARGRSRCLQVAGVLPFASVFCILSRFHSCFRWRIWSDGAVLP